MPDGAGAGYNIPISVSASRTDTTNPVFNNSADILISSPWASTGSNDLSARNTEASTATSAAAQGNLAQQSSSSVAGSATGGTGGASLNIPPKVLYVLGGAFVILLATIIFTRKK